MTSKHWSRKSGIGLIDLIADTSSSWIMHFGLKKKNPPDDNCHRHFLAEAQKNFINRIEWAYQMTAEVQSNIPHLGKHDPWWCQRCEFLFDIKRWFKRNGSCWKWNWKKQIARPSRSTKLKPRWDGFHRRKWRGKNLSFKKKKNSNRYLGARN